jgi:hypothetical protein
MLTTGCTSVRCGRANCMQRTWRDDAVHACARRARDVLTALCCSHGPAEPLISPEVLHHIKVKVTLRSSTIVHWQLQRLHARIYMYADTRAWCTCLWGCYLLYSRLTDGCPAGLCGGALRALQGAHRTCHGICKPPGVVWASLLLLAWSDVTHIAICSTTTTMLMQDGCDWSAPTFLVRR